MLEFHQIFSLSTISVAIILNCFMMFIIMRYSSDNIGKYKYLLLAYVTNAIFYSAIQLFTFLNWVVPDGGYFFLSTIAIVPKKMQTWCITMFVGFYELNLFIVCWSFWHRVYCVVGDIDLNSPKKITIFGCFSVLMFIFLMCNIVSIHPTPEADVFFEELVERVTNHTIQEIGYIGGPFFYNENEPNWYLWVALAVHGLWNNVVIAFIYYCWDAIRKHICRIESIAQKRFQYRIYILLTIQTVLPIIFNATPVIVVFTFSALHWDIGKWMLISGMVISITQVVDPICMAFLITDYKRAILRVMRRNYVENSAIIPPKPSEH